MNHLPIRKGERVAIVGSSGSGKSTLAQLLLRFYQVSSGTISIGTHDIMNISPEYIRKKIAYVSQEISVFAETLRSNLVMDDNSINDEEICKVIKICQLEKTMSKLPMGLESILMISRNLE